MISRRRLNVVARPCARSTVAAGSIRAVAHQKLVLDRSIELARPFDDGLFWVQRVILSFVAPMFPPTLGVGLVDEFILQ